jgi:hypothetical protein
MTGEAVITTLAVSGYRPVAATTTRDGYTVELNDRREAHSVARRIVNEFEADPEACTAFTIRVEGPHVEVRIQR